MPRRIRRLPEHRFASQWPRSQHAALKAGFEGRGDVPSSSSSAAEGRRGRGGPLRPLAGLLNLLFDLKSFLWRTILLGVSVLSSQERGLSEELIVARGLGEKVWRGMAKGK